MPFHEPMANLFADFADVIRYARNIPTIKPMSQATPPEPQPEDNVWRPGDLVRWMSQDPPPPEPQIQQNFWRPGVLAFRSARWSDRIVDERFDHNGLLTHRITTEIRPEGEFVTEEIFAGLDDPRVLRTLEERAAEVNPETRILVERNHYAPTFRALHHQIQDIDFQIQQLRGTGRASEIRALQVQRSLIERGVEQYRQSERQQHYQQWELPAPLGISRNSSSGRFWDSRTNTRVEFQCFQYSINATRGDVTRIDLEIGIHTRIPLQMFGDGLTIGGIPIAASPIRSDFDPYCNRLSLRLYPCHIERETDPQYQRILTIVVRANRLPQPYIGVDPAREPELRHPAICLQCKNFHGRGYYSDRGEHNFLVCGVHPYGNGDDCSDFEAKGNELRF